MFEFDRLDCDCPACGQFNLLHLPEAAVALPLHDHCGHCGAPYQITALDIGIHQDTGPDLTTSITATTARA